jgi:superfamily I DNA and/or RNA helicase
MMEALSVARYLEPGLLQFDVVIMDEASQLKPEDAPGAIAPGARLVVVGDPKQLPPTTFFEGTMDDGDIPDDELSAAETSGAERCCQRRSSCPSLRCAIGNGPVAPRFPEFSLLCSRA